MLGAQESAWSGGAVIDGVAYQSAEELRSFYKLATGVKSSQKGAYSLGNADMNLELGPGLREMRISGIALELSHPLRKDAAGNILLSREDWVKWIDPIMRPTYIPDRQVIRTVVIDPAHGGHDTGTNSPYVKEPEAALQIAQKLQAELEKLGYKVILTRTGDYYLSDQLRIDVANGAEQAIFVSLHLNGGRPEAQGAEVYTLPPAEPGESPRPGNAKDSQHAALAYALQSALVSSAGAKDGGCHRAHFSLLSSITCPAVWVELGYATHAQEGPALASPAYQARLAQALAQGIAIFAKVADPTTKIAVQQPPPRVPTKPATTSSDKKPGTSSSTKTRSTSSQKSAATQKSSSRTQPQRTRSRGKSR